MHANPRSRYDCITTTNTVLSNDVHGSEPSNSVSRSSRRYQRGYCDRLFPPRASWVLSDLVDRIHRGAIYVLAMTIPTVVNRNVFNQHTPCAAPKHFWSKHDSSCSLTAQFAFDLRRSLSSFHSA